MMTVSTAIADALSGETLRYAWLLQIGEDLFFTNHGLDIELAGKTYVSQGDILKLSPIVRERQIKLQSYSIEFSNVDGAVGSVLRAYDRTGETCDVSLVLLNSAGALIADKAISLYRGAFDSWVERDTASTSTISLRLTSPWAKPNLTAGRKTSNNNQQDNYPGDLFFEFAHEEKNTIGWGDDA
jgi:hypothetical protein